VQQQEGWQRHANVDSESGRGGRRDQRSQDNPQPEDGSQAPGVGRRFRRKKASDYFEDDVAGARADETKAPDGRPSRGTLLTSDDEMALPDGKEMKDGGIEKVTTRHHQSGQQYTFDISEGTHMEVDLETGDVDAQQDFYPHQAEGPQHGSEGGDEGAPMEVDAVRGEVDVQQPSLEPPTVGPTSRTNSKKKQRGRSSKQKKKRLTKPNRKVWPRGRAAGGRGAGAGGGNGAN